MDTNRNSLLVSRRRRSNARRNVGIKRTWQYNTFTFFDNRTSWLSKSYHQTVNILIVASLCFAIIHTVDGFEKKRFVQDVKFLLEVVLLVVFVAEYALRIWASGAHGTYGAEGGWKKYLSTPHMVIDAFVIISSIGLVIFFQLNFSIEKRRLLHLFQLLRVLRMDRQRGAFKTFWKVFKRHRTELLTCWYMGFLMVTFVSFLVYALERKSVSTEDNLFNGVYWGVISLTTIGYGDINPETASGKILICCFAVFGTCFLAMPAGIIGSGFALQVAEQQKEKHVNRRRRPAAVFIQSFWRKYAANMDLSATWLPHLVGNKEKSRKNTPMISKKLSKTTSNSLKYNIDFNSKEELENTWIPRNSLTRAEKIAVRFIRFLKCIAAAKKFKQARRPYDERDILDQFTSSQVELLGKLRDLRMRVEISTNKRDERILETFRKVITIEAKVTQLTSLLSENNDFMKTLSTRAERNVDTKDFTMNENKQQ